jgi:hypothetical protein
VTGATAGAAVTALRIEVGPECQVVSGGLQPFLFRSARGTLVLQAQLPYPASYALPPKNIFPGLPGTVVSRDSGTTWQSWQPGPDQGLGPVIEGAIVQLDVDHIRIFDWIADGPTPDGAFTGVWWETTDEWRTVRGPWPCRIDLPQAKGGYDDGGRPYSGVTFHRTVLALPGGELLATIYCWFHEDQLPSSYEAKMNRFRCVLLRSADAGETWRYAATIADDVAIGEEGFDEPVMIRLARGPHAGRLICLMRTGNRTSPLYQSESDDAGATWTAPRALSLRGVDPDLIEMADGTLACSFGYRPLTTPMVPDHGNYVAFSTDSGATWGHVTHLPIEPHGGTDRSTCYTGLREVEPGRLLVVFDIGWWHTPIRYVGRRFVRVHRG